VSSQEETRDFIMINPAYTPEEDQVLLGYTAGLDPKDYKIKTKEFTARFRIAALHLPGRKADALRKRYLRLTGGSPVSYKEDTGQPAIPAPHNLVAEPVLAKPEPIEWDNNPFIRPPSKEQLMGRR